MREIDGGGGNERVRFTVELRPGETTIVSWKKLLKDAAKGGGGGGGGGEASTSAAPPVSVNPSLEARLAPGQPAENELKDGHPTRFTDVIEKIERLYMGKHSSDEEDLNDVPDDDEYDTEDSFIDDAELDDYFQVDNSAIKHDGFFVNRGKLERIIEPTSLPDQQPKKRRRKNSGNDKGDDENGQLPNKTMKVGNKATRKPKKVVPWDVGLPHVVALPSVHNEEITFQSQTNMTAKKKSTGIKTSLDQSVSSSISNIDATLTITGNVERANAPVLKPHDKNVSVQSKSEPALLSNSNGKLDHSHKGREKDGNIERSDINTSGGKVPMQNAKTPVLQRKEGSSIKPKSTNLEKTILELEKMVAESRPQSMEVHDADMASQAGKKRLPREIKLKLAKVARQAQANHGKIPNELVNRLMNILGHWIQVRTLKRNLKDMVATGLTAKKEKDERVQQMKKDVDELIKMRVPYIRSKILEQQAGEPNDFQEMGNEEKEKIKRKYGMDDAIEDKICDLYDLYVDGVDEEAGPQARKLYSELAHLWPEGFMDNHGIKRAICRAKDRKRALYGRSKEEEEKIKRKKVVQKTEGTVRVDSSTISQPQHTQEKSVSEPNHHGPTASNKLVPSITSSNSSNKSVPSTTTTNPSNKSVPSKISLNPSNKSVPSKISLNPSNKSVPSKISLNPSNKSVPSITSTNPSNKLIPSITSTNPSVGISSSARGLIIPDCPKHDKMKEKSKRSSIDLNDKVPTDVLAKKKVKRKPDTGSVGRQIRLEKEKPISSSGDEKSKSHNKQVVGPPSKPSPPINLNNPADMR